MTEPQIPQGGRTIALAVAFEASLFFGAVLLGWLLHAPPLGQMRWTWEALAWGVLGTMPPLIVVSWCLNSGWRPFERLLREMRETVLPLFAGRPPAQLGAIAAMAGLGEETLFRGVMQTALAALVNQWIALGVTSLLFGLAHAVTPTYALLAALIGAYLGGLMMVFDNLAVPIMVHTLYDFVALVWLIRRTTAPGSADHEPQGPRPRPR